MMARDDDLVNRIRMELVYVADVEERKMFGSIGFMVQGNLCLSARAERIMCRINPAIHDKTVSREGCQTVVMKGRPYQGYVYVEAAVLTTQRSLAYWVNLALEYNEILTSARKKTNAA
jgi:TfoX/Sxy family transcriptional regulator of competence genes